MGTVSGLNSLSCSAFGKSAGGLHQVSSSCRNIQLPESNLHISDVVSSVTGSGGNATLSVQGYVSFPVIFKVERCYS